MKVLLDLRNRPSQAVTEQSGTQHPQCTPEYIEGHEGPVIHPRCPSDSGDECPDNGDKPCEYNGFCPVLLVKGVRALQVVLKFWVFFPESVAGLSADHVAGLIADNGGDRGENDQPPDVQLARSGENSSRH